MIKKALKLIKSLDYLGSVALKAFALAWALVLIEIIWESRPTSVVIAGLGVLGWDAIARHRARKAKTKKPTTLKP